MNIIRIITTITMILILILITQRTITIFMKDILIMIYDVEPYDLVAPTNILNQVNNDCWTINDATYLLWY